MPSILRHSRAVLRSIAVLVVAFGLLPTARALAAGTTTPTPSVASSDTPAVVRTLVYRDLTSGLTGLWSSYGGMVVLCDDGSTAIFVTEQIDAAGVLSYHVFRLAVEDGEPEEIAVFPVGPDFDVSADGSRVLLRGRLEVNGPNELRIIDETGERTIVEEGGVEMGNAVISGNGETVFFSLRGDSSLNAVEGTADAGIWRVGSNGSDLRQIIDYDAVFPLTDAAPEDTLIFSETSVTLDASADGDRIAFTVVNYFKGEVTLFGADGDGGAPHAIGEKTVGVFRAAISGDGSTVLCICRPFPFGSAPQQLVVFPFADGDGLSLADTDNSSEKGIMLNEDGSRALNGSRGVLYNTEDGTAVALGVGCDGFGLVNDELYLGFMSAEADRVLYVVGDAAGQRQLAVLDIDPSDPGDAPIIADPMVEPPFIVANDGGAATVTALVDAPDASVCATVLVDGRPDGNRFNRPTLRDGGPEGGTGDAEAGDGLFTGGGLHTWVETTGPATVRVQAEIQGADGRRSAMAVDLDPFEVVAA